MATRTHDSTTRITSWTITGRGTVAIAPARWEEWDGWDVQKDGEVLEWTRSRVEALRHAKAYLEDLTDQG